jgi:protein-disulfide isomerase
MRRSPGVKHTVRFSAFCVLVALAACGSSGPGGAAAQPAAPPGRGAGDVLAVVNGEPITSGDVTAALGADLAKLEEQAYALKKQQVDAFIGEKLLAAEAKTRGITPEALAQQEITAKVAAVSDADIAAFVAANRSRIPGDPAALTPQIRAYLTAQRESSRREAYVGELRAKAAVQVHLVPPPVFRAPVAADGFPTRGPADAAVTIVEFSDFHCPFCRSVQPTLNQLLAKYPTQVRLVYRHLPLDSLHPQARRASEASWCAAQQGQFWPFHDRLYAAGSDGRDATLKQMAVDLGLDAAAFDACLADGSARAAVQADAEEGAKHGITGTPGFFVNGRILGGAVPLEAFVSIIEEELKGAR